MIKPIFWPFTSIALVLVIPCSVPAAVRVQGNQYSTPPLQVTPDVTMTFTIRSLTAAEQEGNGSVPGAAKIVIEDRRPLKQRTWQSFVDAEFGSRLAGEREKTYPYKMVSTGFEGGCARIREPVRVEKKSNAYIYTFETSSFLGGDLENKNPVFDGVRDKTFGPRAIKFDKVEWSLTGQEYLEFNDAQNAEFDDLMEHVIAANREALGR